MTSPAHAPERSPDDEQPLDKMVRSMKLFVEPGQIVEMRALDVHSGYGKPHVEAGFFESEHLHQMATAALRVTEKAKGLYFTLNPVNPICLHEDSTALPAPARVSSRKTRMS
jgi:hypothetical protein